MVKQLVPTSRFLVPTTSWELMPVDRTLMTANQVHSQSRVSQLQEVPARPILLTSHVSRNGMPRLHE
jgi:hypothetical protein